jgi:hypothetical protein
MTPFNFGSSSPNDLRDLGLMVAVHNDYHHNNKLMTFWLMTWKQENGIVRAFKGEGDCDCDALDEIRNQMAALL